jgi:glycosyltransferase involved in cell wall biosynthesis
LLLGLAKRGIKVRAAVIQENPDLPTPGRKALLEAGIPVLAIPPHPVLEAEEAVLRLASQISADPPEGVVFWNLIVSYKLLLAEALLETPVYDVSPGEMYFDSLWTYFEKPRTALPFTNPLQYGRRLSGVAVKYRAEANRVEETLGIEACVIPNGIPLQKPFVRKRGAGLPLVFGTAARLAPQKRIEDLLSALRIALPRLPRCILRIAGGPEYGQEKYAANLRKFARGLPVEWCGEHRDTAEFLAGLDVFVMISEPAGCPNASLEALASGLPVIATDVGGASEQVIQNQTGLLTPPRDDAAFAEAMITLATDAKRRLILGENARQHVAEHFSLESMISSYANWLGLAELHRSHESHPSHSLPNTI